MLASPNLKCFLCLKYHAKKSLKDILNSVIAARIMINQVLSAGFQIIDSPLILTSHKCSNTFIEFEELM